MDMREEFELHYAEEFSIVRGYKPSPEEMVSMRDGDGYGSDRGYLNGYWKGWQASRESLVVDLHKDFKDNTGKPFGELLTLIANAVVEDCRKAIHATGIRTK